MRSPKELPREPGVYLFKDAKGDIIYVGKAKSLRSRVSSYFSRSADHTIKTQALVRAVADIDFIMVDTEVEALLLENRLIKKHAPRYNISLKDSKTYAYIVVTHEPYPRVISSRRVLKNGTHFGPYTDGFARRQLVDLTVKLFRLRVCRTLPKRPCLNYHIGTCTAPCIKNVSREEYAAQVSQALVFLRGETKGVVARLEKEMKEASAQMKFELAREKLRQIDAIEQLHEKQKVDLVKKFDQDVIAFVPGGEKAAVALFSISKGVISGKKEFRLDAEEELFQSFVKAYYATTPPPNEIITNVPLWATDEEKRVLESYFSRLKGARVVLTCPERGEKRALADLAQKNAKLGVESVALRELQEKLLLPALPRVIECFDISNLGYDYVVAGMTQWVDGAPNKKGYRKFRIRTVEGKNDDFASMREVVLRRYRRLSQENAELPGLILIDGGPGQLNAALSALSELGLKIPAVALAKQQEELYLPGRQEPLQFDRHSRMMLLLRSIRDSVHHFAISYNRKRRQMRLRDEAGKK